MYATAPPGYVVVPRAEWAAREQPEPAGPPAVVAVEAWFADGASVAAVWPGAGRRAVVSVTSHGSADQAARAALGLGAGRLLAGKSMAAEPTLAGAEVEYVGGTTRQAVARLRELLDRDEVGHTGSTELAAQVLRLRTVPSPDGPRLRSSGRGDAVKALTWAVDAARKPETLEAPAIY